MYVRIFYLIRSNDGKWLQYINSRNEVWSDDPYDSRTFRDKQEAEDIALGRGQVVEVIM